MKYITESRPDFATTTTCEVSPLTQNDRATIARVLTWDRSASVQAHEVITIAVTNGIVQVTNLATKKWGRLITTQTIDLLQKVIEPDKVHNYKDQQLN